MILTLDNLASRYHCLPSEALERGTTLDLHVLDISARWNRYQHDLADGKVKKEKSMPTQDEMFAMIKQVREQHGT